MYIYFWHSVQLRLIVLHKKGKTLFASKDPTDPVDQCWLLTNQRKPSLKNPIKDPAIRLSFWGSVMLQTEFLGELCGTGEFKMNHISHN